MAHDVRHTDSGTGVDADEFLGAPGNGIFDRFSDLRGVARRDSCGPVKKDFSAGCLFAHQTVKHLGRLESAGFGVPANTGQRRNGAVAKKLIVVDTQNRHIFGHADADVHAQVDHLLGAGVHGGENGHGLGQLFQPEGEPLFFAVPVAVCQGGGINPAIEARFRHAMPEALSSESGPVAVKLFANVGESPPAALQKIVGAGPADLFRVIHGVGGARKRRSGSDRVIERVGQDDRLAHRFGHGRQVWRHLTENEAVVRRPIGREGRTFLADAALDDVQVPRAVQVGIAENSGEFVPPGFHAGFLNDQNMRDATEDFFHTR